LDEISEWTIDTDVAIVGFGCAGAAAAIEATAAGADTLIIDRAGGPGGTSALSSGAIYLGGGTPIQRACGFEDSVEDMYTFLVAACGPDADEAKIAIYCGESVSQYQWLVERCGVEFLAEFCELPGIPPGEQALHYVGGENAYPFNQVARPAPRGHKPRTEGNAGWMLMDRLVGALGHDAARLFDTRVERLVVGRDGRVVGAVGRRYGREVTVRARRGVILTAGGFIANDRMLAQYMPLVVGCEKVGGDTDDGSGIRMAQAAGAAIKHIDAVDVTLMITPPLSRQFGILVNGQGQRFINEDTYFGRVGYAALYGQGGDVYLVVDQDSYGIDDSMPVVQPDIEGQVITRVSHVAGTARELEESAGFPVGSLEATLDLYNRHAQNGEDVTHHKSPEWVRPLVPPYGVIDYRRSSGVPYWSLTLGGLHTNVRGEVLNADGDAIPGLYAAGRTTSGIAAHGYCSGLSLGDGMFFGRRAGCAAAGSL
jgi:3-oxo-5alpha-steroid 4-dehydrogenase